MDSEDRRGAFAVLGGVGHFSDDRLDELLADVETERAESVFVLVEHFRLIHARTGWTRAEVARYIGCDRPEPEQWLEAPASALALSQEILAEIAAVVGSVHGSQLAQKALMLTVEFLSRPDVTPTLASQIVRPQDQLVAAAGLDRTCLDALQAGDVPSSRPLAVKMFAHLRARDADPEGSEGDDGDADPEGSQGDDGDADARDVIPVGREGDSGPRLTWQVALIALAAAVTVTLLSAVSSTLALVVFGVGAVVLALALRHPAKSEG